MFELTFVLAEQVTPWFTNGGLVGGLLGTGVGVFGGGIYGPLVGICAPRGKAKTIVFAYHFLLLAIGVVLLGAGIVAATGGQPYGVYYPLLLCGGLLVLVIGCLTPVLIVRYAQADQRRLDAEEFRRRA